VKGIPTRTMVLVGLLAVMLLAAAGGSGYGMVREREAARRAAQALAESRALARAIEALKTRPRVASDQELGVRGLGERIERALAAAGSGRGAIEGVFPRAAEPVADSPYRRKAITLSLRSLSLEALAVFLAHLTEPEGLHLHELHLKRPSGTAPPDTWDAEVTLMSLFYGED